MSQVVLGLPVWSWLLIYFVIGAIIVLHAAGMDYYNKKYKRQYIDTLTVGEIIIVLAIWPIVVCVALSDWLKRSKFVRP